jgi:hypothetical protein
MAYGLKTQEEMSDLNLENPIFVIYVDITDLTRNQAKEKLESLRHQFSFDNVTTWIFADKINKVDVIWQGSKYSENPGVVNFNNFENLINRCNEVLEVISDGVSDTAIKQKLRDLQLKKVLNDDTSV